MSQHRRYSLSKKVGGSRLQAKRTAFTKMEAGADLGGHRLIGYGQNEDQRLGQVVPDCNVSTTASQLPFISSLWVLSQIIAIKKDGFSQIATGSLMAKMGEEQSWGIIPGGNITKPTSSTTERSPRGKALGRGTLILFLLSDTFAWDFSHFIQHALLALLHPDWEATNLPSHCYFQE